jgi:CheY-like chemotaxis protein
VATQASPDGYSLEIQVGDTGEGISADKLPHIFDRFFQAESRSEHHQQGSGIGLALVREYVHLLGGTIGVESQPGAGTTFTVRLPVHREGPPAPARIQLESAGATDLPAAVPLEVALDQSERPLLLVVEDNADVIYYLRSLLHEQYRVVTAANGEEGLHLARTHIPDIIISDIMMPVMDGLTLLDRLKSDPLTSHIPVIMLTARADQSSRLSGLERGAEAYLAKPFQPEELFIRLRKLLELRQLLRERYASLDQEQRATTPAFALEDQFMTRVREILALHLDDESFGIAELCRELAMSRTQVYRKFAALTDMTVNQYLRRYRLYEARKLLRETDLSVGQVALEVGLPNLSYFSRAFTETFGVNPSQVERAPSS